MPKKLSEWLAEQKAKKGFVDIDTQHRDGKEYITVRFKRHSSIIKTEEKILPDEKTGKPIKKIVKSKYNVIRATVEQVEIVNGMVIEPGEVQQEQ